MVEVLAHLRANGFRTYIVSGGGIEFMRAISDRMYGIPPDQVIGSSGKTKYELRDGTPVLVRLAEIDYFDDKEGKPVAIQKFIGQRPIAAFGNSDGDQQMLQWTAAGQGRSLTVLVDHTDADREFDYRVSPMGTLKLALEEADQRGWTVVSMKDDWKEIFAPDVTPVGFGVSGGGSGRRGGCRRRAGARSGSSRSGSSPSSSCIGRPRS